MLNNFAKLAIEQGGYIKPLVIPTDTGTGLMNPSIMNDNGVLRVNLRQVNYTFYHSEKKLFHHPYGPLTYIHPEHDPHLRTWNWYLELNDSLDITRYNKIDTSKFDTYKPCWDFVGLEDARIFRWEDSLWISGVRRDTTPNGQGRMELSKIVVNADTVIETERYRIEPPKGNSYCEKNWMPILDKPWHYVKWSNPAEIVKVDIHTGSSSTVSLGQHIPLPHDLRGGPCVIPFGAYYLGLTHEVLLTASETGRKDAVYLHRFVLWDKTFSKIIKHSDSFLFMDGQVEFSIGMCEYKNKILITYGFQDNAAYILSVNPTTIMDFINE